MFFVNFHFFFDNGSIQRPRDFRWGLVRLFNVFISLQISLLSWSRIVPQPRLPSLFFPMSKLIKPHVMDASIHLNEANPRAVISGWLDSNGGYRRRADQSGIIKTDLAEFYADTGEMQDTFAKYPEGIKGCDIDVTES